MSSSLEHSKETTKSLIYRNDTIGIIAILSIFVLLLCFSIYINQFISNSNFSYCHFIDCLAQSALLSIFFIIAFAIMFPEHETRTELKKLKSLLAFLPIFCFSITSFAHNVLEFTFFNK